MKLKQFLNLYTNADIFYKNILIEKDKINIEYFLFYSILSDKGFIFYFHIISEQFFMSIHTRHDSKFKNKWQINATKDNS